MNRRQFMTTAASSVAVATMVPFGASTKDAPQLEAILNSFDIVGKSGAKQMAFFLVGKNDVKEGHFHLKNAISQPLPDDKSSLLDGIKEIQINEMTDQPVAVIIRAANTIAKETLMHRGNHYAVMDDHVLVWYKGSRDCDSPLQRFGDDSIALHPHFKNFFVKIKGIKLQKHHHEQLEKQGLTRVV